MTLEHELSADLFGLVGTFPRPGWVVLDAARSHRFTGELIFDTTPEVGMYFDRGRIYLAERRSDPSLGSRLVDAGALSAAQLEHGSLHIGGVEHLGRLFERVPSVDRHSVIVTSELMTEECVGWVAKQSTGHVQMVPYQHHPSGIHRWDRIGQWLDLNPGDPLPAPVRGEEAVELSNPEPLFTDPEIARAELLPDDLIEWSEPAWLDEGFKETRSPAKSGSVAAKPDDPDDQGDERIDWDEHLDPRDSAPQTGVDPVDGGTQFSDFPADSFDRFEVVWPSGEVDEQFGGSHDTSGEGRDRELDRVGPTARLSTDVARRAVEPDVDESDAELESLGSTDPADLVEPVLPEVEDEVTDEVVLAVRRAVATIDTGSLSARRRIADTSLNDDTSRGHDLATREPGASVWAPGEGPSSGSVFDELPAETVSGDDASQSGEASSDVGSMSDTDASDEGGSRASALKRLIGSLRRH